MANYCTVNDVEVALGFVENTLDATSQPTLTQATREIGQITNEIDFYLKSGGITVQPTDTTILARLRNLCTAGVACKLGMGSFGNADSVDDSQPGYYCDQYSEGLKEIKEQPELFGKVTGDETAYISNQVTDGTTTEAEQNANYFSQDFKV